jgi:sec-independent protein translocase protein TatB
LVKAVRSMTDSAKERMRDEMGPEYDDVDWKKLDPRQYDPRRIIRTALLEDVATEADAADDDTTVASDVANEGSGVAREPGQAA